MLLPTHAGVIAFKELDNGPRFLLVTERSGKTNWVLPKGHIELGESPRVAAIRELYEEAGVTVDLLDQVDSIDSRYNLNSEMVTVQFFLGRALSEVSSKELRGKLWANSEEAIRRAAYPETKKVLRKAFALLKNLKR